MADSRQYTGIGIGGALLTVCYFLLFAFPLTLESVQEVGFLAIYTMAWAFWVFTVLSVFCAFILFPFLKIPKEEIRKRRPYIVNLNLTAALPASLAAFWLMDSPAAGVLVGLLVFEGMAWVRGKLRPRKPQTNSIEEFGWAAS
ncbi:MAG: hypothetical protein AB1324_01150 [Candidatus Micrarchaeota archaeon]